MEALAHQAGYYRRSMCGRYTLVKPESAADRFGFVDFHDVRIQPRFNIAPSQTVLTVVERQGRRELAPMRWGFQPAWLPPGRLAPPINARAETLLEKPLWRGALRRSRCLVLADGYYEWQAVPGQRAKQAVYSRLRGWPLFAFAGLHAEDAGGAPTCAIVTTQANALLAPVHQRMPAILEPDAEALWLDEAVDEPGPLLGCLHPYADEAMEAYPVAELVNHVRNDGPELVQPLPSP